MAGSTISSTITNQVTLGYGILLSPLTITNTGDLNYAGGYPILVATGYDSTIVNNGSIFGSTDGIYTTAYAVTIFNHGTIHGDRAGVSIASFLDGPSDVVNSAVISGIVGVQGSYIDLTNTGSIEGTNFGIRLSSSTIVNSGTIIGQTGAEAQQDMFSNSGLVEGVLIGVYLGGGSAVNTGTIAGDVGARIVNVNGNASLTNNGYISGGVIVTGGVLDNGASISGSTGVSMGAGGYVTNSGYIYGQAYGVIITGPSGNGASFINSGSIYSPDLGVTISGAYMRNSGSIGGGNIGVSLSGGGLANYGNISSDAMAAAISGGSLANSGTLAGLDLGVSISSGTVTNFESISGGSVGAGLVGGSLANYGKISGAAYGVEDSGGTVMNDGMISGASDGVLVSNGMLTNTSTIVGGTDAVYGSFITLGVEPGAVFIGNVVNKNGPGLLDLEGAGVGSLGGIGSQIKGFGAISFGSGANWVISGDVAGLANGVTIAGMTRLDTIVLDGFSAVSESFVSGKGLEISDGTTTVTLDITGSFPNGLTVTETNGNAVITDVTCFAAGTGIATPDGNVPVEQLQIGDLVRTLHAGDQPVKWVGWRHYDGRMIAGNTAALPVCIKQDAIADGMPAKDLWVSPGHAIAIDNVLVHASRLVNGVSVVQAPQVETITYYHVELDTHEVLLAENCPAESFQNEHFRKQFVNAEDFQRRYPGEAAPAVLRLPRLDSGFQLNAIHRQVAARAGISPPGTTGVLRGYVDQAGPERCFGWAQDMAAPATPVSLDIMSGSRLIGQVLANLYRADVHAAGYGNGYQGFEFLLQSGFSGLIEVLRSSDGAKLKLAANAVQPAA